MKEITLYEGIEVTLGSLILVLTVLLLLQIILTLFKYIFPENQDVTTLSTNKSIDSKINAQSNEADEEEKMVAVLIALIMANKNQPNKNYQVHSVKRL